MNKKAVTRVSKTEVIIAAPPPVFDGSIDGLAKLVKAEYESVADARRRLVELIRGEEDMKKFVKVADKVFLGKKHIPGKGDTPDLDFVCERAGTNRSIVFGAVARVLHRYHFDVAQIVVGAVVANRAHEVATAMADGAALPGVGHADRRLFMEVAGAKQKGVAGGVQVNVSTNASAQAGAKAEVESVGSTGLHELPSFESGIKNMAARLRAIPVRAEETR